MERLVKVVKFDGPQTGEILAALDSMIERAQKYAKEGEIPDLTQFYLEEAEKYKKLYLLISEAKFEVERDGE